MASSSSNQHIVAERYAKALLDTLENDNAADATLKDLSSIKTIITSSEELKQIIENPTITRKEKRGTMEALAKKSGIGEKATNLLTLLADNNRLESLINVIESYESLLSAKRGEVALDIITASKLDDATANKIKASLEKSTGKKTKLELSVDPNLLGGIVIKLGSVLMDYSVKGKLQRLEQSLKHQIANT